jgi:hypothetical protein
MDTPEKQRPLTFDEISEILDTRADDTCRQGKDEIWALVPKDCVDDLTDVLASNGVKFTDHVPEDSNSTLFKIKYQA